VSARLVDLIAALRALPEEARRDLARAALTQLSELACSAPRVVFRPVGRLSDPAPSSIYEPAAGLAAPRVAPPPPPLDPPLDPLLEARMLAILDSPAQPGEPIDLAFRRKELELTQLFGRLDVLAARALHRRLVSPSARDALANRFSRFVAERRARLLAFLGDARRREALRKAA